MIHCFYHNDMDGHCAGAIVKMKHPDAMMHEINYGYDYEKDVKGVVFPVESGVKDVIYIVDFSFSPEELDELEKNFVIHWLDHHKSAIDRVTKYCAGHDEDPKSTMENIKGTADVTKAGAQLTWEYLYPDKPLPLAVYYVSQWDIWDHSDPKTIPFQRGLSLTESTDPVNEQAMVMWKELFENNREGDNRKWNAFDQVMNLGVIGEAMKAQYDNKIAKNAYYVPDWEGYRTVALNSYVLDSYCIFDHADKWEEYDPEVLVWYYQTPDGRWIHSIRSYPGTKTNVLEIAERHGGGGHVGAAGVKSNTCLIFPTKER